MVVACCERYKDEAELISKARQFQDLADNEINEINIKCGFYFAVLLYFTELKYFCIQAKLKRCKQIKIQAFANRKSCK